MKIIKIDQTNRNDIIRSYAHRLLDDMDFDTLYTFAYEQLVINKDAMNNESLEIEILDYYPEILTESVV